MLNRLSIEVLNASDKTVEKVRKSLRAPHNHKIVVDFNTLIPIKDKYSLTEDQLMLKQKDLWGSTGNAVDAKFVYPNIFLFSIRETIPQKIVYFLSQKFNNHVLLVKLATENPSAGTKSVRVYTSTLSETTTYTGGVADEMWNFCWQGVKEPVLILTTQDDAWAGFTKWGC